ncbi:MAG: CoA transferase subunit A [Propionibacteriaceae bacterium]
MAKLIETDEAVALIKDGMTIMVGGFLGCGSAHKTLASIANSGVKNLTLIVNDGARIDYGGGQLIANKQVSTLIASHIGTNPEAGALMNSGEMEVTLVPQGSLVEKIRAGGAGLGGVLTPTGLGTLVAEDKEIITVDGKPYLLEKPLRADIAILGGHTVDMAGNIWYKGTSRNFNDVMAMAADTVIVEATHLVDVGGIEPENVVTPGVLVDYIVDGSNS